jgi:hypothetical protein
MLFLVKISLIFVIPAILIFLWIYPNQKLIFSEQNTFFWLLNNFGFDLYLNQSLKFVSGLSALNPFMYGMQILAVVLVVLILISVYIKNVNQFAILKRIKMDPNTFTQRFWIHFGLIASIGCFCLLFMIGSAFAKCYGAKYLVFLNVLVVPLIAEGMSNTDLMDFKSNSDKKRWGFITYIVLGYVIVSIILLIGLFETYYVSNIILVSQWPVINYQVVVFM